MPNARPNRALPAARDLSSPCRRALIAGLLLLLAAALPAVASPVFINEIHYDNSGTDTGEAIEIAAPAGTDLAGWSLVLYNGNNSLVYNTTGLAGIVPGQQGGFGTLFFSYPTNGIQNGAPDGVALVDPGSAVVEFLSYEGAFVAGDGPAAGMMSTDIGVAESSGTAIGESLQRVGTGADSAAFTWAGPVSDSFGFPNTGQTFTSGPVDPLINEFVANHTGSDTEAFVEILGSASTDYSSFTVLEIEGDGSGAGTIDAVLPVGTTNGSGYWIDDEDMENGTLTILLVENFSGSPFDDLDTDNDGVFDVTPWDRIVDDVATSDGGGSDQTYSSTVLGPFFDGSPFGAGGASRIPNGVDTDSVGDWLRNDFDGAGFPGFPGSPVPGEAINTPEAVNEAVPLPIPEIVINEIIQNPAAVSDADGEWFELFNASGSAVDIDGWTIKDNDFDSHVINNGGSLVIAAGAYLVLGREANPVFNGGVAVDYQYSGVTLANGSDELVLLDGSLNEVDRVEWDNGATFPDPNGASMALVDPAFDNNVGGNWCTSSTPFGDGDLGSPGAANDCPQAELVINEIDYDQPSGDTAEFIEIANVGGAAADLSLYQLELVNGSGGSVYNTIALPATSLAPGEYFVVCGDAANVANCDLDTTPDGNLIQNGAPDAVALTLGGSIVDTVSYEGDVAGFTEGSGAGLLDDASFSFQSISRIPDGFDSDQNNADFQLVCITPGSANVNRTADCTPTGPAFEIWEIQGAGASSPFAGGAVTTLANAVTALGTNGFFMQTPPARTDGDVDTSDGIFVFTGAAPTVAVGDLVDVSGQVIEFFGFTEFSGGTSVTVVGNDPGQVPAPVAFDATVPSPDPAFPSCSLEYECYEGMRVEVANGYVAASNQEFGSDPFAEIHVSAAGARAFREPGIEFPGIGGLPVWDGNPEVFELDPDKLGLPNQAIPAGSTLTATGVLGFEFNHYELWPNELTVVEAPLPVAVRARAANEMTIGSLNFFRLFDDVDDPPSVNVVGATRNDQVVSTADYLLRRSKLAAHIVAVLDSPDILAVQEVEKIEVLDQLALDINAIDPTVNYTNYLIEGNDVGTIDVGFMVRDRIAVDSVTQLGYSELFTFDDPDSALHDRPPLLLEGTCDGLFPVAVMVLHQRSLGGIETDRVQRKRYEQAESVAQKVQDIQSADPSVNLIVLGDFNAFEFTDGYVDVAGVIKGDFVPADSRVCGLAGVTCVDLVDPNLTDQVLQIDPGERYSFIFRDSFNAAGSRGDSQVLDHAMTSSALDPLVTGYEYGRGNADAAEELVERDGTEPDAGPNDLFLRASDHDGLVLYVFKDEDLDGVGDGDDVCPGTQIPESVPTRQLGVNRFALTDGDGIFDTTAPRGGGNGPGLSFTIEDTAGCSCEQIIDALELGNGHTKFGCSISAMEDWVELVGEGGGGEG